MTGIGRAVQHGEHTGAGQDGRVPLMGTPSPALATGAGPRAGLLFGLGLLVVLVLAVIHLTQGTSALSLGQLVGYVTGRSDPDSREVVGAILSGSRIPRLVTGLLVGLVLGIAGVAMQSLARNPLASPDTLAVNAGAELAVAVSAVLGISLPGALGALIAFAGGLVAAAMVVLLGGSGSSARLVLAGTALALALGAVTGSLKILFREETGGLFAWGSGSLLQVNLDTAVQVLPVMAIGIAGLLMLSRRMDLLALGDDTASLLGVHVGRVRVVVLVLAVLLASCAVTLAGPIGFVGLFAPAIVTMLGRWAPGLARHRLRYPAAAIAGAGMVLGADVALRALFGATAGVNVPTAVVTSIFGAVLLIVVARRMAATRSARSTGSVATASPRRFAIMLTAAGVLAVAALVVALLFGGRLVLLGDVANWLRGLSGWSLTATLDERVPRVLAAFLAGAALAAAGTTVQAVCRNPLAEPGLLGISAGAGLGAVLTITLVPNAGIWTMAGAAAVGAFAAFAVVYLLGRRGGLDSGRLVLVGIGVSAGGTALIAMLIVLTDPWNKVRAITWLSGSTYGRTFGQILPVAAALVLLVPMMIAARRRLDLLALDDDVPRLLGVELERTRLLHLAGAAILTAASVCAVGVISFVGLVAPHCARALVGARHGRVIPVAVLLGGVLVSVGDTVGRTVIHPDQLPAGLIAAVIGAPYFIYLLWRTRD